MNRKVLLIMDHELGEQARECLGRAGFDVTIVRRQARILQQIQEEMPDLLFIDLTLPEREGWAVALSVADHPALASIPVAILTGVPDQAGHVDGLNLAADEFIVRPFEMAELAARARLVLERRNGGSVSGADHRLKCGDIVMDTDMYQVTVRSRPVPLTPTEFQLLKVFLENPGRALTRSRLLEGLCEGQTASERLLDAHIKNLRRKIERNPKTPEALQTVYRVGYRLLC